MSTRARVRGRVAVPEHAELADFWRAAFAAAPSTPLCRCLPTHPQAAPASWGIDPDDVIHMLTLLGPIPLAITAHWLVLASTSTLAANAISCGGTLPDVAEFHDFRRSGAAPSVSSTCKIVGYDGANAEMSWHPVPGTMGLAVHDGRGRTAA